MRRLRPLVLVLVLAGLTWRQCGIYRDRETLWTANLAVNPARFIAHNNLGVVEEGRGNLDEALRYYQRAHALAPDDAVVRSLAMLESLGLAARTAGDRYSVSSFFLRRWLIEEMV